MFIFSYEKRLSCKEKHFDSIRGSDKNNLLVSLLHDAKNSLFLSFLFVTDSLFHGRKYKLGNDKELIGCMCINRITLIKFINFINYNSLNRGWNQFYLTSKRFQFCLTDWEMNKFYFYFTFDDIIHVNIFWKDIFKNI